MSVEDDLRGIANRAHGELDSVHDFFEHSKIVWRSFQILVDEGHKVSAENLETGTRIECQELACAIHLHVRHVFVACLRRDAIIGARWVNPAAIVAEQTREKTMSPFALRL